MEESSCITNYNKIKKSMEEELKKSNREITEATLIAVSKTKPKELIEEVYSAGCRDFGENYVQELLEKIPNLPKDIRWHMIGHLQTNKVKSIIDKVYMIHSVDSFKLAEVISKEAQKKGITVKILLEVNVAEEQTKFGFTYQNVCEEAEKVYKLPNIQICGLMTSAPIVDNPEDNSKYFSELKQLLNQIALKLNDSENIKILSMGMTLDYPVAIREGATYIRVGTAIFGARNYNK